jgi:hypothetical protein
MAKARKKPARESADWRHLAATAALLVGVFGTLLLGAVLQVDRDDPALGPPADPLDRRDEPVEEAVSPPVVEIPADDEPTDTGLAVPFDGDADLVDRAADDERRLQASGSGYTLQFAVNCEIKNVRANLESLRKHQNFYLLTMLLDDRACFRLCWGFYDNERQAMADRTVPETLRAMTDRPKVLSIAEALP